MADNTKIGPIFRGANGGLSDDLFTGIKNSFHYSNDMEIRQDAKSIFPKGVPAYADPLTRKALGDAGSNITASAPRCIIFSEQDAGWIVFTYRKVYKIDTSGNVTQLCEFTGEEICDAEIFNGYFYISTKTHLFYKKDTGGYWADVASATDISDPNFGRCTSTLTSYGWHPLYGSDAVLCIGDTNKLRRVTKEVWDTIQDGFTLQSEYYIRHINELGGFIRVSAVNAPFGSEVLLWDKVSSAPNEVIPLEGYKILQSAIYNGYHYLLSDKGLGMLNGYQYYLLKKAESNVNSGVKNGMAVYDDKLFFVANDGIYIYGAKNKNYADVLNLWHKVEDGFDLGALGTSLLGLMVSREGKHDVHNVDNIPIYVGVNEGQATTGEVQTMCYFGTSMSGIKQSMYLRVGYHIPKHGDNTGNIHIYYRTEADATSNNPDNWDWHELTNPAGLYKDWDMRCPFATSLKLNCRFQWIQFKFVLTNCVWTDDDGTHTKDTNLYSADLYYNDMLD